MPRELHHRPSCSRTQRLKAEDSPRELSRGEIVLVCAASAYILLIYFKPVLRFLSGETIIYGSANVLAIGLGLSMALKLDGRSAFGRRGARLVFLGFALVAVSLAALNGASAWSDFYDASYSLLATWLAYVMFGAIGRRSRALTVVLVVFAVSAFVNSAIGVWGAATGNTIFGVSADDVGTGAFGFDEQTGRSGGVAGENYVGMFNVPALVIGMEWVLGRGWRRLAGVTSVAVSAAAIGVSLSRTSVLTGAVALSAGVFLRLKRGQVFGLLGSLSVIAVAALVVAQFGTIGLGRVGGYAQESIAARWSIGGVTGDIRYSIWDYYAQQWMASPVFGLGPGFIRQSVAEGQFVPHNSLLDILVEFGACGLAVYLAPLLASVSRAVGRKSEIGNGVVERVLVATAAGMLISLLTLSNAAARPFWAFVGAASGRMMCVRDARGRRVAPSNARSPVEG
ncbi:O-antigen ligase [Anaeromyxobacter sp. SG17]|uniref:O-antigen ligase family protein n=1 Tax=Anaeromyxobacter sp. SG17 TaxID=2925405 RepID=UPI001F589737|nr:O-antigen ligase family protein [Anaeromyxobacter sp. SG17]